MSPTTLVSPYTKDIHIARHVTSASGYPSVRSVRKVFGTTNGLSRLLEESGVGVVSSAQYVLLPSELLRLLTPFARAVKCLLIIHRFSKEEKSRFARDVLTSCLEMKFKTLHYI